MITLNLNIRKKNRYIRISIHKYTLWYTCGWSIPCGILVDASLSLAQCMLGCRPSSDEAEQEKAGGGSEWVLLARDPTENTKGLWFHLSLQEARGSRHSIVSVPHTKQTRKSCLSHPLNKTHHTLLSFNKWSICSACSDGGKKEEISQGNLRKCFFSTWN